jgi:hypothetical protein
MWRQTDSRLGDMPRAQPCREGGTITPDGYGVVNLSAQAPLHILLELDRATEPARRLHDKATRYVSAIPRSVLSHANPLIIIAVPTLARAQAVTEAIANTGAPITVAVWDETGSALAIIATARRDRPAYDRGRDW